MPSLKVEQLKKWTAALPEGWRFDVQKYLTWGDKEIYFDGAENAQGVFYRMTLEYREERNGSGWAARSTGRQLPTVQISRYTPTGSELYSVVHILTETAGDAQAKKNYNALVKLAGSIDTGAFFRKAAEKDTGKAYNDLSEFFSSDDGAAEAAQEPAEEPAPAEAAEEEQEAAAQEEAAETAAADDKAGIAEGMLFQDSTGAAWTITGLDSMKVELNNGERMLFDFGTSRTIGAVLNALGSGSRFISETAAEGAEAAQAEALTAAAEDEAGAAPEAAEAPETAPEEAAEAGQPAAQEGQQEAEQSAEEEAQEDIDTAAETAAEAAEESAEAETALEAEETEAAAEGPAEEAGPATEEAQPAAAFGSMYAELAKAYFSGKTIKGPQKGRKPQKAEQAPEAAEQAQEAAQSAQEAAEAQEPEKPYIIGYEGNDNGSGLFTDEERERLQSGYTVSKQDRYYSSVFFCCRYSDRASFLYRANGHVLGDSVLPSASDAKYHGFMIGKDIYTRAEPIMKKLREDLNRKIIELVPDEETAEKNAESIQGWERERVESIRKYEEGHRKEARYDFFRGKRPELFLHDIREFSVDCLIQYIQEPEKVIEREARAYCEAKAAHILETWIKYNIMREEYNAIIADMERDEHRLLKIMKSITDEKTVRIELSNGNEVKVEAGAVKNLPFCGYISSWNVNAADRKNLLRDERGRDKEITLEDIKAIYHGGRILYQAA